MTWRGQAGQDAWVHSLHPEPGFFCDVGAHDGVTHSNTKALEEAGWTGLCIEPNRQAFLEMVAARGTTRTHLWGGAVSSKACRVPFDGVRVGDGPPIRAWPLAEILDEVGAPDVIDYLSIDVEGHELEVLGGMDFSRWRVDLLTIEHNLYSDGPERKDAMYDRLTAAGFDRVVEDVVAPGYGPYEDWYRRA